MHTIGNTDHNKPVVKGLSLIVQKMKSVQLHAGDDILHATFTIVVTQHSPNAIIGAAVPQCIQ